MKKIFALVLFLLLVGVASAQQVAVSDVFKKTVEKVARKKMKTQVINYITKQDLITGIAASDMIGQIIDSHQDEEKVIRAIINVVTTRLFIGNIRDQISAIIDTQPDILINAREFGWNRSKLEIYSSLYYYYCERMKNHLYISPYIMEMALEKNKIEALKISDTKWTVLVSKNLVREKRKNITLDIRSLEFFQFLIGEMYFRREGYQNRIDSTINILADIFPGSRQWADSIAFMRKGKPFYKFHRDFVNLMAKSIYGDKPGFSENEEYGVSIKDYFAPLLNIIISTQYELIDPEELRTKTVQTVIQMLENWLNKAKQGGMKMEYIFSLAATGLAGPENGSVDFTVLDQARYVFHQNNYSGFIYAGGFLDPIIKNTVYKDGSKYYLAGLGAQYKSFYLTISGGLPYTNIRAKNARVGLTLGYEIPVWDIVY